MSGHEAKPDSCNSCYWETDQLEEVDCYARIQGHGPFTPDTEKSWGWMCYVCRSTMAGQAYEHPRSYGQGEASMLSTIAWATNYIASLIKP